jgi:hypothetical protein
MARPEIDNIYDMNQPAIKRAIMSSIGTFEGLYEIKAQPKRDTRSLRQNAAWWALVVTPIYQYLREQEADVTCLIDCHEMLREHFLKVPVFHPGTGELIGHRFLKTSKLSKPDFADLYNRVQAWALQSIGVVILDPDPFFQSNREMAGSK